MAEVRELGAGSWWCYDFERLVGRVVLTANVPMVRKFHPPLYASYPPQFRARSARDGWVLR